MSKNVSINADRLKILLDQNKEMKELITEGYEAWNNIASMLGIGEGSNLMLKIPKILKMVNSNPDQFANLVNPGFAERLKKYVNDDNTRGNHHISQ